MVEKGSKKVKKAEYEKLSTVSHYYFVLFCSVLFCFVLFCSVLLYFVLFWFCFGSVLFCSCIIFVTLSPLSLHNNRLWRCAEAHEGNGWRGEIEAMLNVVTSDR